MVNMNKPRKTRRQRALKQAIPVQRIVVLCAVILTFGMILVVVTRSSSGGAAIVDQKRLNLDAVLGNPNAPVTIIEYGAYSCTSCRAWHKAGIINQILAKYPDKVRFIFRDFPVITPPYDRMAAALAQCALDQGQDRFWIFHNALYEQADARNSQEDLIKLGGQVGLDMNQLKACAKANTYQSLVQDEESQAHRLGLPGTPSFLVNDQPIFNASPEILEAAVQRALHS